MTLLSGGGAHADPDGRPKPLHDPDPYDTPPYGEPGPWAPAPPVQHPATTPAHGTAVPPLAQGAPVPSTPVPGAGAPVPGPSAPGAPGPAAPPVSGYPASPWQNYDPWAAAPFQQSGAPIATQQQRRKRARKTLVLGAVLIALVTGGIGGVVGATLERNGGIGGIQLPQAGQEPKGRAADSTAGIAARALPGVVTLHVKGAAAEDTGTGFVLDQRGHILTNNHVVEPAASGGEISVTFNSGETAKATVVGRDTGYDLAVVKVRGVRGLRPIPLGNSDNVQVGDPVVAIGAPFNLAGTVTSGIISAKERPITAGGKKGDGSDVSYVDALQTDAPINPGNSGGPLLDGKGRVVGINSAIRSADRSSAQTGQAGSIGLGFAIPVNQAKRVAEELINTGRATHPVIGVTLDMSYTGDGARVGTNGTGGGPAVKRGGPGDKAGVKPDDVITEVDGVRVHSGEELIVKTRAQRPGDRLELTVVRDGAERKITLVLGSADGS
ncbi:protease [Streptomyces colonosanans]|uniref:Protease n=1 Tax=Streptomyces colonosanans TaxID=1428652 RepID=A0A1S2NZL5_9ACTN|nr:protease [Streptomyces colonosanans]